MNILVLGSGGREHAIAWKLDQSPKCTRLYIAPGNAGTDLIGENVPLDPLSFPEVADFAISHQVDLLVVGPEVPLALGIRDYFEQRDDLAHILLVGPDKMGAMLESSKDFAKKFMVKHGIPTAGYATFDQTQIDQGLEYITNQSTPIVLKADGLAAGKGVVICDSHLQAQSVFKEMLLESKFGEASSRVVVEDFLSGVEISVFVITDGNSYKILPSAKDYKRIGEKDTGPNTGGMGAVSPVPFADEKFMTKVREQIIEPTVNGIKTDGLNYKGFIFFGLINVDGEPMVIEYNVRMGDPETQAVLPRITSDLVDLLIGCANGSLEKVIFNIDPRSTCTVVMVAGGYPGSYEKGHIINGLNTRAPGLIFHAGTKKSDGNVQTNGGRVLAVTAIRSDTATAISSAFDTVNKIDWENAYYRKDIGQDILAMANNMVGTSTE